MSEANNKVPGHPPEIFDFVGGSGSYISDRVAVSRGQRQRENDRTKKENTPAAGGGCREALTGANDSLFVAG